MPSSVLVGRVRQQARGALDWVNSTVSHLSTPRLPVEQGDLRIALDGVSARDPAFGIGGGTKEPLVLNWIIPPPFPVSGGQLCIFRFIRHLAERGHASRIFVYDGGRMHSETGLRRAIQSHIPEGSEVRMLSSRLPSADFHLATAWTTAFAVTARMGSGRGVYWVQDFEPWFYPRGTLDALARLSYGLKLPCITLGRALAGILEAEFDASCDWFPFSVDPDVYKFEELDRSRSVCFYARPGTARRGTEFALEALRIASASDPDLEIHLFGDRRYRRLPFRAEQHGVLSEVDLSRLYGRCAAGLCLSYTNTSLAPPEMMASGCIPIVNDSDVNRLNLEGLGAVFGPGHPAGLAETILETVDARSSYDVAALAAKASAQTWSKAADAVEDTFRRAVG